MKTFYTDGSCYPNPLGPGGWAYVRILGNHIGIGWGHIESTTSNRAELTAIIEAFRSCKITDIGLIITDSQYSANACYNAHDSECAPIGVANEDLIGILHEEIHEKDLIDVMWEQGHSDNIYNEIAHEFANFARLDGGMGDIVFDKNKLEKYYRKIKEAVKDLKTAVLT